MNKIIPDGGYAPDDDTPFNLYKDAAEPLRKKFAGDMEDQGEKPIDKGVEEEDDDTFVEKAAPGVEIRVPGLDREGALKKVSQGKHAAISIETCNGRLQQISAFFEEIGNTINHYDADDMLDEISSSFEHDISNIGQMVREIRNKLMSGGYEE